MFESTPVRRVPIGRLTAALALVLALALSVFVPHVASAQDPTGADASVRFVHASPDTPAVDVVVDGAVVAPNLAFGQATAALSLSGEEHQVQFVPTGGDVASALVDTTFDPDGGTTYIVALSGQLKDIEVKTYDVHKDELDTGKSRLRVINLAPGDVNIDVYVTGVDELSRSAFASVGLSDLEP